MVDLSGYCTTMIQHTRDWDARFRVGDTPWEDDVVAPSVIELVREYAPVQGTVLEIGCGRGTTAIWLADHGYRVVACDISSEAVAQARQRAEAADLEVPFLVADVLSNATQLPSTDVVFTRGVLHTFTTPQGRAAFATAVYRYLPAGGLWLDISGSTDTPDDPDDRIRLGLPRLSLSDLAAAVEPHFEILSIRRATYGVTPGRTDFLAWSSALRRRPTSSPCPDNTPPANLSSHHHPAADSVTK